MKRTLVIIITFSILLSSVYTKAAEHYFGSFHYDTEITVNYPDGSIRIIQAKYIFALENGSKIIEEKVYSTATRSIVNHNKTYYYVNDSNIVQWTVTLDATFTYNGSTSSCTSASSYSTVYQGNWSESDNNTFASGNAAVASVTMVRKFLFITVETQVANLTITCDKDGNIQ